MILDMSESHEDCWGRWCGWLLIKNRKLQAENKRLKDLLERASEWFNTHCGHGQLKLYDDIEQALKEEHLHEKANPKT